MKCSFCHFENPQDNHFCGKCGRPLTAQVIDAVPRYSARASMMTREMVIVIAGVLAMLVAAYGAWYFLYQQNSPGMIVRRFIEADRQSDFTAQRRYVSTRWDSRIILSALQTFRGQSGASLFKSYDIGGTSLSGETAQVSVTVTLPAMPTLPGMAVAPNPGVAPNPPPNVQTLSFFLIRENGEWRIDPTQTLADVSGVMLALGIQRAAPLFTPPAAFPGFPAPATPVPPPTVQQNPPGSAAPGTMSL